MESSGDDTQRSIVFDISRRNVWPAPFNGRCLNNEHLRRWLGHEVELLQQLDREAELYAAARSGGDFDKAAVIAGESVSLIHEILPAGEVIRRTVAEAAAALEAAHRLLVER